MYNEVSLFTSIIAIVVNILAFIWVKKLEDISCECSENWMRDYIKYYLIVFFIFNIIGLLLNFFIYSKSDDIDNLVKSLINNPIYQIYIGCVILFIIAGFINIGLTINYIQILKDKNCDCSEDVKREIYWYYNILLASVIALYVFLVIITIIYFIIKGIYNKIKKIKIGKK